MAREGGCQNEEQGGLRPDARMLSNSAGGKPAKPPNHPGAQISIVHLLFLPNPILLI